MSPAAGSRLLIVSNRLPVSVRWRGGRPQMTPSTGGLATGLSHLKRDGTVWIGWSGDSGIAAERADELHRLLRERALTPIRLSSEEVEAFYDGFSNGVVWPLFHYLIDRVRIRAGNWEGYRAVNERFADAVALQYQPGDQVWIHDYHLMLVPGLLRERIPAAQVGFFLHIPFPAVDVFRTLPWRRELLEGLLGSDVIGFHTRRYASHFMSAVRRTLATETTAEHVWWRNRPIRVGGFPMGIDVEHFEALATRPDVRARADTIRQEARGRRILLGVDRLDYTKGIPRRLLAFQRMLEREPSLRNRVRFIQIAVPSRVDAGEYRIFRKELDELIGRINGAYGSVEAVPIHYLYRSISQAELVALYCAADVMVVTPLRDGMNLVAKEFVASRLDDDGVLVLSEFAGAADELDDAVLVNPYDVDNVARGMMQALALEGSERLSRMETLRSVVKRSTVHDWAGTFLERIGESGSATEAAFAVQSSEDARRALAEGLLPKTGPVTLLLDYEGTLVPYASTPDEASPDAELCCLLTALAERPEVDLHLVSGRSIDTLNRWFASLDAQLWAEHGAAHRRAEGVWEYIVAGSREWMGRVRPVLEEVTASTPGALLEVKTVSLAWHFRRVDARLAEQRIREIRSRIEKIVRNLPVELLEGRMVLELRPRGISKGLVVRHILASGTVKGPLVAIGDDNTDEHMFTALPRSGLAIHAGGGPSAAPYRLADSNDVRDFLNELLRLRGGSRQSV